MWAHFIYMNFSWNYQHESFAWYVFLRTGICGDLRLGKALGSQGVSFNWKHPRKCLSPRNREVVQSQPRKPQGGALHFMICSWTNLLIDFPLSKPVLIFDLLSKPYDLTIRRTLAHPSHARTQLVSVAVIFCSARNFRHLAQNLLKKEDLFAIYPLVI